MMPSDPIRPNPNHKWNPENMDKCREVYMETMVNDLAIVNPERRAQRILEHLCRYWGIEIDVAGNKRVE
jgi:hypothetical protein